MFSAISAGMSSSLSVFSVISAGMLLLLFVLSAIFAGMSSLLCSCHLLFFNDFCENSFALI